MTNATAQTQPDTLDIRRRRALFRATHRGTREMDLMLGRYATAGLGGMDEAALTRFEAFIQRPDPELQKWLMNPDLPPAPDAAELVALIRAFHAVGPKAAQSSVN